MALGALIALAVVYAVLAWVWRELGRIDRHAEENDA